MILEQCDSPGYSVIGFKLMQEIFHNDTVALNNFFIFNATTLNNFYDPLPLLLYEHTIQENILAYLKMNGMFLINKKTPHFAEMVAHYCVVLCL